MTRIKEEERKVSEERAGEGWRGKSDIRHRAQSMFLYVEDCQLKKQKHRQHISSYTVKPNINSKKNYTVQERKCSEEVAELQDKERLDVKGS